MCKDVYGNFDHKDVVPIKKLDSNLYVMELFYGPTFAFKDYAMQFLGNLFSHCMQKKTNQLTILGATSGDTGSAAIHGLSNKKGARVFILYPEGRISDVQERQMTCTGAENIFPIAINGSFDDAQRIVKDLFAVGAVTPAYPVRRALAVLSL